MSDKDSMPVSEHEIKLRWRFHEREHRLIEDALSKADSNLEKRLEGMNEFREQLNFQAGNFITRDTFDRFIKENDIKSETAINTTTEKIDNTLKALVNRHDSDYNSLSILIQSEREARKILEGSISTWKWIAGFLGASGVAGIILLYTNSH